MKTPPPRKAPPTRSKVTKTESMGFHPRNVHQGRYDFKQLMACQPELTRFVVLNELGNEMIDFTNPAAVKALNQAVLRHQYGITEWDIPAQYFTPQVPSRADYLHYLADLLATSNDGNMPRGDLVRVLDIGVGASCIYPIIGHHAYGWKFVGSDIDTKALDNALHIINHNRGLNEAIELRFQPARSSFFKEILQPDELFDLVLCNPPFYASLAEAQSGKPRKAAHFGKQAPSPNVPGAELYCKGGEAAFVSGMVAESKRYPHRCLWFTALVTKSANLASIYLALKYAGVAHSKTIEIIQGNKKINMLAWTFFDKNQQKTWRETHWK